MKSSRAMTQTNTALQILLMTGQMGLSRSLLSISTTNQIAPWFGSYNRQGAEILRQSQPLRHIFNAPTLKMSEFRFETAKDPFLKMSLRNLDLKFTTDDGFGLPPKFRLPDEMLASQTSGQGNQKPQNKEELFNLLPL
jgi:hypothetical protein